MSACSMDLFSSGLFCVKDDMVPTQERITFHFLSNFGQSENPFTHNDEQLFELSRTAHLMYLLTNVCKRLFITVCMGSGAGLVYSLLLLCYSWNFIWKMALCVLLKHSSKEGSNADFSNTKVFNQKILLCHVFHGNVLGEHTFNEQQTGSDENACLLTCGLPGSLDCELWGSPAMWTVLGSETGSLEVLRGSVLYGVLLPCSVAGCLGISGNLGFSLGQASMVCSLGLATPVPGIIGLQDHLDPSAAWIP